MDKVTPGGPRHQEVKDVQDHNRHLIQITPTGGLGTKGSQNSKSRRAPPPPQSAVLNTDARTFAATGLPDYDQYLRQNRAPPAGGRQKQRPASNYCDYKPNYKIGREGERHYSAFKVFGNPLYENEPPPDYSPINETSERNGFVTRMWVVRMSRSCHPCALVRCFHEVLKHFLPFCFSLVLRFCFVVDQQYVFMCMLVFCREWCCEKAKLCTRLCHKFDFMHCIISVRSGFMLYNVPSYHCEIWPKFSQNCQHLWTNTVWAPVSHTYLCLAKL